MRRDCCDDGTHQLHVLWHDRDTLCVNGGIVAKVSVKRWIGSVRQFEEQDHGFLDNCLQTSHRRARPSHFNSPRHTVSDDVADKTGEWKQLDEHRYAFLIMANLAQCSHYINQQPGNHFPIVHEGYRHGDCDRPVHYSHSQLPSHLPR